jgi:hypothetical protein
MIFKQFYLPCLAHASYLIGDEATGTAAVVDPQRDTDQYLAFAGHPSGSAETGLRVSFERVSNRMSGFQQCRNRVGVRGLTPAPWGATVFSLFPRSVGPWRSWERASMASRRSRVRIPSAPPNRTGPSTCIFFRVKRPAAFTLGKQSMWTREFDIISRTIQNQIRIAARGN